jgi:hypothetical protein
LTPLSPDAAPRGNIVAASLPRIAKIMEPKLLAAMYPSASPKSAYEWHGRWLNGTNISAPQSRRCHIFTHDRVAAKPLLIPQPLKNPMRRTALLLVNLAGVDPRHIRSKLPRCPPFVPAVAGRNGKTQHLRDCIAVEPQPASPLPCSSARQPSPHV